MTLCIVMLWGAHGSICIMVIFMQFGPAVLGKVGGAHR